MAHLFFDTLVIWMMPLTLKQHVLLCYDDGVCVMTHTRVFLSLHHWKQREFKFHEVFILLRTSYD